MSDVRVTIGANSAPLESEFEKVKNSARGLKKSVGDVGGVLEGDRRVENKMTAFVEGFKSAQNGADLLANTMGNLGDVFKSSLAIGVGLNVGAALVGMISDVIKESDALRKAAKAAGDELRAALTSGDSGALESAIKKANVEMEKLTKKASGIFTGTSSADSLKLFNEKLSAGTALIDIARQELEVQKLIAAEEWDKADALAEEARLTKERAKLSSLNLPMSQYNALNDISNEESELRLEAKRDERRKAQAQKDEQTAKEAEDAEKKRIDAEQQDAIDLFKFKEDRDKAALAEREQDEAKALKLGMEAFGRHEAEKTRIAEEEEKKRLKAAEDADKLALEGNKQALKEQEDIVKKGAQEQKQRDDRAMQALQGGGGLQALQAQRLSDRQAEAAREKAAGILARDEIRRKFDGDATKMTKEEIADAKARILGEKQLDKKKIEAAIAGIPKIEAEIAKLVAKLGVK
jgi:hypothetical protein